ncbi:MAG: YdbH domain-containing protein [Desulfococcaceae bacterium]
MLWKRKIAYGAVLCLFLMLCICASLWFSLPVILNSERILQYARNAGLEGFSWNVCRIGLKRAEIGNIGIGTGEGKALAATFLEADYSITGLRDGHIPAVRISGLELNCGIRDGHFFLQYFDLPAFLQRFPAKAETSSSPDIPPFSIGKLELRNALILFAWEKERFRIPLELTFHLGNTGKMDGILTLFPGSQEIRTGFDYDFSTREIQIAMETYSLRTGRFSDLISRVPGLSMSGQLDMQAEARMQTNPFDLSYACVSGQFRAKSCLYGNMQMAPFGPEHRPFAFEVQTADGKQWDISASDMSMISPFPFTLSHLDGILNLSDNGTDIQGNISMEAPKTDTASFHIKEALHSKGKFSVLSGKDGNWECSYAAFPNPNPSSLCNIQTGEKTAFVFRQPEMELSAKGQSGNGSFAYDMKIPQIRIEQETLSFELPLLQAKGNGKFGKSSEMTADLRIPEIKMTAGKTAVSAKNLSFSAKAENLRGSAFRMNGEIRLSEGSVSEENSKTLADGIRISFPFQWPWKKSEKKGEIHISSVKSDIYSLGGLSGFVRQDDDGVNFGGRFKGTILPGLQADVSGKYAFLPKNPITEISLVSRHQIKSPLDLGKFHKSAKGTQISGLLDLKAGMISDKNGFVCQADASFTKGNMRIGKEGPVLDGIDLHVSMPDLPGLRSAPGQQMKFDSLRIGNILLDKGDIRFQIESGKSFLMEKAQFDWCKGRVNAHSLRIIPGHDDYDLILYCDRLNLAKVLEQLGAAKAEGEGTVNGRIPIRFAKGELIFDDGFLYSTPGDGGTIHLKPSELVMAGIPKDTPQAGQLDLAAEALKDYEYQWVKMLLSSEGDNLMMRVNFDGKPLNPLPFVYKEDLGGFVRVESGGQLSRFQGIRLNVNLAMPLNKILRYRGAWDKYK